MINESKNIDQQSQANKTIIKEVYLEFEKLLKQPHRKTMQALHNILGAMAIEHRKKLH